MTVTRQEIQQEIQQLERKLQEPRVDMGTQCLLRFLKDRLAKERG